MSVIEPDPEAGPRPRPRGAEPGPGRRGRRGERVDAQALGRRGPRPGREDRRGHRRIAVPDLLAFLRGRGRPAALGLLAGARRPRPAASLSPEALADLLLAGDVALARDLLLDAYATGRTLDELGDAIIGPAMGRVGTLCAADQVYLDPHPKELMLLNHV
jgi:hypothetical protein